MAYYQDRQTSVGELLNGTFRELLAIRRELAIYFAVFFVVGLLTDLVSPIRGVSAFAAFCGYFVGQYWLYREALTRAGITVDERFKVFSLFFMAVLLAFPISIGFNIFYLPGILLASKWIMAPTFLVAERDDLFKAMGNSWRASENNMWSIAGAFTVLTILWVFIFMVSIALAAGYEILLGTLGSFGTQLENSSVFWLGIHTFPVLLLGLSISAYRALGDDETSVAKVFE